MIDLLSKGFESQKLEFLQKVGSYEGWAVPEAWPLHPSRPNGGYPANSIFFSEALALYILAKHHNIDMLIESGVYRGGSTSLWGRIFSDKKIFSVDFLQEGRNSRKKWDAVQKFYKPLYPNITFIEGDGNIILPQLISENSNLKIGVFVDGPKDKIGLKLAEKCISFPNVYFSSLHDWTRSDNYFNTRSSEYRKMVGEIDKEHPQILKYPNGPGLTIINK